MLFEHSMGRFKLPPFWGWIASILLELLFNARGEKISVSAFLFRTRSANCHSLSASSVRSAVSVSSVRYLYASRVTQVVAFPAF